MLFQPFESPRLSLRNRLVIPPMATFSCLDDGSVNPEEVEFLGRRAVGGFGLIVTGACYVIRHGRAFDGQWGCENDSRFGGLKAMADAIHEGGAKAYLQIHHGGRHCPSRLCGCRPLCASEVPPAKEGAEAPAAMTEPQIWETIRAFADGAKRAQETGYDGVEIHGANGYLLQQFVSPHTNRRADDWGRNRLAFPLAVVDAVLNAVGSRFGVGYRLSPDESDTPGLRMTDTFALVDALCERPLAYLHLSTQDHTQGAEGVEGSALSAVARHLRDRMPLIGVGGVRTLGDAQEVLSMGADLVAVGRAAITEPDWPNKTASGIPPRLKFPREGAAEKLTIPKKLAEKMLAVPGWADVEEG
jgi:2,4-dienoyl-CoA reductase-like NADH-dependent reductase (Old Yellow Enzyme family)